MGMEMLMQLWRPEFELDGINSDLHMGQLIPLPLTVSCSRKSRLVSVLPFWYWHTQVVPDKIPRAVKRS